MHHRFAEQIQLAVCPFADAYYIGIIPFIIITEGIRTVKGFPALRNDNFYVSAVKGFSPDRLRRVATSGEHKYHYKCRDHNGQRPEFTSHVSPPFPFEKAGPYDPYSPAFCASK